MRFLRLRSGAVIVVVLASVIGCSLFNDPDRLRTCEPDCEPTDASTRDQSVNDTGAPSPDSSAEGSSDGGDGGPFRCSAAPHAICDDFEDPGPLGSRWTKVDTSGGGALALTTDASVSPSHALASSVPDTASGASAALRFDLTRKVDGAHCELDLQLRRVESGTSGPQVLVLEFDDTTGALTKYLLRLVVGPTTAVIREEHEPGTITTSALPGVGLAKWVHIAVDASFTATGTGSLHVVFDGVNVLDVALKPPAGTRLRSVVLSEDFTDEGYADLLDDAFCDFR